jgi:hypothetical protein
LHDCAIRVRACAFLIYRETILCRCAELSRQLSAIRST